MSLTTAIITLLLLMDPLGNAPVFRAVLGRLPGGKRRQAIARELVIALAILMLFLYFGRDILSALGITPPALSTAGGVVLFLVALRMLFPTADGGIGGPAGSSPEDPWIVPLAIPMVAGPSSMAWVMLLASSEPDRMATWTIALIVAWSVSAVILLLSDPVLRILKDTGAKALERLMGIMLTVVAVQMLMNGIGQFLRINQMP